MILKLESLCVKLYWVFTKKQCLYIHKCDRAHILVPLHSSIWRLDLSEALLLLRWSSRVWDLAVDALRWCWSWKQWSIWGSVHGVFSSSTVTSERYGISWPSRRAPTSIGWLSLGKASNCPIGGNLLLEEIVRHYSPLVSWCGVCKVNTTWYLQGCWLLLRGAWHLLWLWLLMPPLILATSELLLLLLELQVLVSHTFDWSRLKLLCLSGPVIWNMKVEVRCMVL